MFIIILPVCAALITSAMLIAPFGLNDIARPLLNGFAVSLVVAPVVGWRSFLIAFVVPPPGSSRLAAVLRLWIGTSLLLGSIFTLMRAGFDYTPTRPGPSPWAGFLLADLSLSMFVSCGVWGAFAPVLAAETAFRGAFFTGCVLAVAVALLGWILVD